MNKLIIIGSNAINKKSDGFRKNPSDFDYIGHFDTVMNFVKNMDNIKTAKPFYNGKKFLAINSFIHEFSIIQTETQQKLYNYIIDDPSSIIEGIFVYPNLDILYSLKESHKYLRDSPHFLKTMEDIKYLRNIGCSIPDNFKDLYKEIERETYDYSHPILNQKKNEFFNDTVNYKYDHDTIHEAVKINNRPAHTFFIKDGSEVLCSKKKFFSCSEYIRNCAVLEESYVLALERSIIPHNTKHKRKDIFDLALMKVCSSITSGWFREWAWENYNNVQLMYNDNFVEKFEKALSENKILPYKRS